MSYKRIPVLIRSCVLGFGLVACGPADGPSSVSEDEIVGGVRARQGEFPWMTALLFDGGSQLFQFCGGSLIRDRWVVTASHCVEGLAAGDVRVGIGQVRISQLQEANLSDVVRIVMHPRYDAQTSDNDIALLELAESFSNVPKLRMVAANEEANLVTSGRSSTAIGWGATRQGGDTVDRLRKVDVPIVGRPKCRDQYRPEGIAISGLMICAGDLGNGGEDSCQGDSGGPLIVKRGGGVALAGVTSFGIGCARRRFPGVYANVARLSAWVDACIAGDCN